jgi:hypothetical protein
MRIASQIPNSDQSPLYDVRNHAHASRKGYDVRSDVSRTIFERQALFERQASIRTTSLAWKTIRRSSIPSGGARRDRTDDLMLAKHALSQLSYGPVPEDECFTLMSDAYARSRWWAWEDLNFRPHAYQARALTN